MSGSDKIFIPEWGPPQEPPKTELAWLIERGGLCLGFCDRKFAWITFTNEQALRFSRRSDAIRFIEAMRDVLGGACNFDDVLVTEHQWG